MHWVEVLDKPILEDVGALVKEKSVEDLVKVPINKVGSRFFCSAPVWRTPSEKG